jgi:drug/metabolite transporter (DMT)-like permease
VLLPSGQAAVLGFTMPIWAALLSWLVFKERLTARMLIGVLMATMGVAFLAYAARGAYASAPLGFIYGLGAGLGWAGGTLILKRANLTAPSLVSTGWQLLIAAAPITVVAFIVGTREAFMPSWTTVLVIGYIAIVPMTVGNVTWFAIVKNLPATVSGLSAVMVPIGQPLLTCRNPAVYPWSDHGKAALPAGCHIRKGPPQCPETKHAHRTRSRCHDGRPSASRTTTPASC